MSDPLKIPFSRTREIRFSGDRMGEGGGGGGGFNQERYLDDEQMLAIENFYSTDDTVMSCRNKLHLFMFQKDVKITWGKVMNRPLKDSDFITEMKDFFIDALDSFLKFGFVVWVSVPGKCGQMIPKVPETGSYRIKKITNADHTVTYIVDSKIKEEEEDYDNEKNKKKKKKRRNKVPPLMIEVVPGFAPFEGTIRSKSTSIMWFNDTVSAMFDYTLRGTSKSVDIPLLAESRQEKGLGGGGGGGGGGGRSGVLRDSSALAYFDTEASKKRKLEESDEDNMRRLNAQVLRAHRYNRLQTKGGRVRMNPKTAHYEAIDEGDSSGLMNFVVPNGLQLVTHQLPVIPPNILEWESMRENKICKIFGVPLSIGGNRGGGGKQIQAAVVGDMTMFNSTIVYLKSILKNISESVLQKMFELQDRKELVYLLQQNRDNPEIYGQLERELSCKSRYVVEFGTASSISIENLQNLRNMDILTLPAFAELASSVFGIPKSMIDIEFMNKMRQIQMNPIKPSRPNESSSPSSSSSSSPSSSSKEDEKEESTTTAKEDEKNTKTTATTNNNNNKKKKKKK